MITETRTAQEYAQGYADGRTWADQDLDNGAVSHWLGVLAGECDTWRRIGHASTRAYYLGAYRGYRERVRTQDTKGRWGT